MAVIDTSPLHKTDRPNKRLPMPEKPPADLKDQIKRTILGLVNEDNIQIGHNGHVTFEVTEMGGTSSLNVLLSQARYYDIFYHTLRSNGRSVKYEIFHNLFPELARNAKGTRDQVKKTMDA